MKPKTVISSFVRENRLVTKSADSAECGDLEAMMIDWSRIRELRSEIGEDGFDEVVCLFLEEADEVIARLSVGNGAAALAADLHFLKGAALNLGFGRLSTLCQDGERRAGAGDLSIDLEAVRDAYATCRGEFEDGAATAFAA